MSTVGTLSYEACRFRPRKNALFQAAAHGTASEVAAMLVSLSFAVGESEENESDEGNIRTFDVNEEDSAGNTPLLLTCRSGKFEMSDMLVSKGADVNAKDSEGNSLLLLACRSGNFEMAEMLVVAGAGVSAANKRRDTAFSTGRGRGGQTGAR